jgi:flagellar protein FlaG
MSSEFVKPTSSVGSARMLKFPEITKVSGSSSTVELKDRTTGGQSLPRVESDRPMEVKVKEAVGNLNDFVQKLTRTLQFSVDEESGRTVIKVVDSETNQLIRQIPPEEVLVLARNLANGEGVILKEQA